MKTKSVIVLSLILVSTIAMPTMVAGYGTERQTSDLNFEDMDLNQDNIGSMIGSLFGGFGSILGGGAGGGGAILGEVFQMLFTDMYENLTMNEMMSGVYVFNATKTNTTEIYNKELTRDSQHYLPHDYYDLIDKNKTKETVYCDISTTGTVNVTYEVGAGVTLIIWDNDKSFVNTLMRIINFVKSLDLENGEDLTRQQITEGLQLISWFFIHINDIINGDELFVLNPITWQKMTIDPNDEGVNVNKTWMISNNSIIGEGDSELSESNVTTLESVAQDPYTEYLASGNETIKEAQTWTEFTFDLFQLWVKKFHVNIDLGELSNLIGNGGGGPSLGDVFKGLDVEFFLFTHHLTGTYLYNDTDHNSNLSIDYANVTVDGEEVKTKNNRTVQVPKTTEITNRLFLQNVSEFNYISPKRVGDSIEWGINVTGVNVSTIPVGIGLDSLSDTNSYMLDNIYLGFSFEPESSPYGYINAPVKLDQHFGEWSNSTGELNEIEDLDLAVIYVSTALHFHLQGTVDKVENNYMSSEKNDFNDGNKSLSIGNYISGDIEDKLEFVNITGPGYNMSGTNYPANTSVIPLGLWEGEMERRDTFNDTSYTSTQAYVSEISIEIDFQVMAYAVCYPEFDGSGNKIIHDPTFNVFMVFPGGPTFEAVILLAALIAPFGLATVIITLLKRRRII